MPTEGRTLQCDVRTTPEGGRGWIVLPSSATSLVVIDFVESISLVLLEDYISHRIPRILRLSSSQGVSFTSVFEPTEFVASFATTAGAVFTKTSDTSLWVLRAKLRNSSSDSATVWGKISEFCGFCVR